MIRAAQIFLIYVRFDESPFRDWTRSRIACVRAAMRQIEGAQ